MGVTSNSLLVSLSLIQSRMQISGDKKTRQELTYLLHKEFLDRTDEAVF